MLIFFSPYILILENQHICDLTCHILCVCVKLASIIHIVMVLKGRIKNICLINSTLNCKPRSQASFFF